MSARSPMVSGLPSSRSRAQVSSIGRLGAREDRDPCTVLREALRRRAAPCPASRPAPPRSRPAVPDPPCVPPHDARVTLPARRLARRVRRRRDSRKSGGSVDGRDHRAARSSARAPPARHAAVVVGGAAARRARRRRGARATHLRRARPPRQPAGARAPPAGRAAGIGRRADAAQPRRVGRGVGGVLARRATGSRRSTGTSPAAEAGYIVDDCGAKAFVAGAAQRRGAAAEAAQAAPGRHRAARGRRRDRRLRALRGRAGAPRTAHRSTTPRRAARCSTRRARPAGPRACTRRATARRSPSRPAAVTVTTIFGYEAGRRAPVHRAALPRRAARVLAGRCRSERRRHRAHGRAGTRRRRCA